MSTPNNLTIHDVKVGDDIPPLEYDVSASTVVLGAIATRDCRPMHHDRDFAINRNGVKDIFLNTPNLAHWFERYVTDWVGPYGRPGRMNFAMRGSVFAGDHMTFNGKINEVGTDETGCGWIGMDITVQVEGATMTSCKARFAVPTEKGDNPWSRKGDNWKP